MKITLSLIVALAASLGVGCGDDFTYAADLYSGRFEVHEIHSDGSVGFVVPTAGLLKLRRTGDSHDGRVPSRMAPHF